MGCGFSFLTTEKEMLKWAVCTDCNVWAWAPPGFDENKHFVQCSRCRKAMYLHHTGMPSDAGYMTDKRIDARLMNQKGY